ncbi:MAG: DUF3157 family protein [Chitinispirillales bacterium]|jgi:hypothetical protein|nr:DUF3157 family protein [Chitinispirillales bacterium]
MMIKKFALMIALAAAVSSFAAKPGSTMSLTLEDGEEVVLQPDSTWDYVKRSILAKKQDDVYITLSDNRVLWLKSDYTWTFTKEQPKSNKPKEYPAIAVVGTATRPALDIAVNAATEDAFTKAVAALRRHAPATKKNIQPFLLACLKNETGAHGVETAFNSGKAPFKADAKISLTPQQVFKIMDCLEVQLE